MQQLMTLWKDLSLTRKAIVVGATLSVFLAVIGLSRVASQPSFALLYSGLEPAAAGEVVQALQQRGVTHQVRGSSILVPDGQRDHLRLTLASEGMPATGGQGYELLDGLSGFGTTSRMFDAAYLRAKEGELARTIVASPEIATARVHIASGSDNPLRRDLNASASVHLMARSGGISAPQAQAIRHLVAAAVTGLEPAHVAIIDGNTGLVAHQDGSVVSVKDDERAAVLREKVQRLVEARVGLGNAVVEVSVDTITDAESITERRFDPDSRFVISSDTEERSKQSENSGGGAVTVASNLPDGDANASESETAQSTETRERLNYEVSETTREVLRQPGAIRRLTVAVLVNGETSLDAAGTPVFTPLPEEEMLALRDLVASAVGFDAERGDAITIKSLPFQPVDASGTLPIEQPLFSGPLDTMALLQLAALALVAFLLGLFVIRPILTGSRRAQEGYGANGLPYAREAEAALAAEGPVLTGTIEPDDEDLHLPVTAQPDPRDEQKTKDSAERLRQLIEERRSETVEILRSWLDERPKEEAR